MIKSSNSKPTLRCSLRPRSFNNSAPPELSDDHHHFPTANNRAVGHDVRPGNNNTDSSCLRPPGQPPADHGRRFKKTKLNPEADNGEQQQSEIFDKLPLRSRDPQQGRPPTKASVATRRLRKSSDNNPPLKMPPSPPSRPVSPPSHSSSAPRTTKGSHRAPHIAVNGDVEEQHMTTISRPQNGTTGSGTGETTLALNPSGPGDSVIGQKRSLRSHDGGSRSKSELAVYFPNYEEILSLEPTEPEFLSPDTTIFLVDDLTESLTIPSDPSQSELFAPRPPEGINPLRDLHNTQVVDLPTHTYSSSRRPQDELTDDMYFKAHRRHERGEKQLRNIERERAQHEKQQLDRLLADLRGHDWLRVMGISGITDSEKKLYEPKRAYFVKEVSGLLDKFKAWKEEEKRRKLEKDELLAAEDEEVEDEEEAEEGDQVESDEKEERVIPESPNGRSLAAEEEQLPDVDDVDGWAAHQLQLEAMSATPKGLDSNASKPPPDEAGRRRPGRPSKKPHLLPSPSSPPKPEAPFTSFYDKPHLRAAALGQNRRGRTRMAFGQPLPEMPEREFCPPDDILTPDAIIAARRRNRRRRREEHKK